MICRTVYKSKGKIQSYNKFNNNTVSSSQYQETEYDQPPEGFPCDPYKLLLLPSPQR